MSTISDSRIKSSSIMFTDIVGYSKMVGKDENHALQLLDKHNKMITGQNSRRTCKRHETCRALHIKMGCLRPGQWNLLCEDDDSRIHKDAEIDAGEVRL